MYEGNRKPSLILESLTHANRWWTGQNRGSSWSHHIISGTGTGSDLPFFFSKSTSKKNVSKQVSNNQPKANKHTFNLKCYSFNVAIGLYCHNDIVHSWNCHTTYFIFPLKQATRNQKNSVKHEVPKVVAGHEMISDELEFHWHDWTVTIWMVVWHHIHVTLGEVVN